jgi:hypothetical protein
VDDDERWATVGMRPGGQKELVAMHSTIAFAYQKNGEYFWRTDLGDMTKDRGHKRLKEINCTDVGFWQSYIDQFPEEEAAALGEA